MTKASYNAAQDSRRWILGAVLVCLLSWAGLWGVIQLPVTAETKAIFFVLLFVAIVSTMMPPVAYLNARFGRCGERRVYRMRFVRQSVWIGLYVIVAAWLQTQRALNVLLALILLAVFILTETFLISREAPSADL